MLNRSNISNKRNALAQTRYDAWLAQEDLAADSRAELESIADDPAAITDRFYRELAFGTGGLRGILGAGTNRMNGDTVRRATQGLANYLLKSNAFSRCGLSVSPSIAIGYDSRINSTVFAQEAACVLAANGITAYLYPALEPTPALSWAVRYLHCDAGICVTASHNPAQYNGYKVYGADGCQITLAVAEAILQQINAVEWFTGVKRVALEDGFAQGSIQYIPDACLEAYINAVYAQRVGDGSGIANLRVVYTPLNGSGLECVRRLLAKLGVTQVTVVPEQEKPDGHFPTCPYPNPEIREAMERGLQLCDKLHPDLLLGTDPDCDRCGAAVPDKNGHYTLISGNEMGLLLLNYICQTRLQRHTMPDRPVAVTTIVSTGLADAIAAQYGVELRRTLTGFKFIGEQIGLLEADGEADRYIFGFEESYGYLSGSHVRDKDAVNAVLLICEAAACYAQQGKTLLDVLEELYTQFGYEKNALKSYEFAGAEGMQQMAALMQRLRQSPPVSMGGRAVTQCLDYAQPGSGLPLADVLAFQLDGGGKIMIRPSGTEPKMKAYLTATERSAARSMDVLQQLTLAIDSLICNAMSEPVYPTEHSTVHPASAQATAALDTSHAKP